MFRWLLNRFPKQEVGNGYDGIFFWRYTLLRCRWGAAYLHEFQRSDGDRCLHDHPWGFVSLVLRGGYFEEMRDGPNYIQRDLDCELGPTKLHWRRPGSLLVRSAETAHRIVLDDNRPRPWSLVFVGRKTRPWGFWTWKGWRQWEKNQPNPICETTP